MQYSWHPSKIYLKFLILPGKKELSQERRMLQTLLKEAASYCCAIMIVASILTSHWASYHLKRKLLIEVHCIMQGRSLCDYQLQKIWLFSRQLHIVQRI